MDMQIVYSLFRLFSGEEDAEKYMPVLKASAQEVKNSLLDPSTVKDVRLCYLTASVANLRYLQIYGAQTKALATYAGNVSKESEFTHQLQFAQLLMHSYEALCADLIQEKDFYFEAVRG